MSKEKKEYSKLLQDLYLNEPNYNERLIKITSDIVDSSVKLDKINTEIIKKTSENIKDLTKINSAISESNKVLFNESINLKNTQNTFYNNLKETSVKYEIYYPEINKIKLDKDYTSEEENFVKKLGFKNRVGTWDFAFCILAYRNRDKSHFKQLFYDDEGTLNCNDINSLMYYSQIFNNQRNKFSSRLNKKNKKGD